MEVHICQINVEFCSLAVMHRILVSYCAMYNISLRVEFSLLINTKRPDLGLEFMPPLPRLSAGGIMFWSVRQYNKAGTYDRLRGTQCPKQVA